MSQPNITFAEWVAPPEDTAETAIGPPLSEHPQFEFIEFVSIYTRFKTSY